MKIKPPIMLAALITQGFQGAILSLFTRCTKGSLFCFILRCLLVGILRCGFSAEHQRTDLLLYRASAVNYARDFSAAYNHNSVAKIDKHVKVFADEYDRYTLFFLLIEKMLDGI